MAQVTPFHSVDPADQAVYHDRGECLLGRRIIERHRRPGRNRYPRCFRCAEMTARVSWPPDPPPVQFPEIYLHPGHP